MCDDTAPRRRAPRTGAATAPGAAGGDQPSAWMGRVLARCRSLELAPGASLPTASVYRVDAGLIAVGFADTALRVLHLLGPGCWFQVAAVPPRLVHRPRGFARLAWLEAAELAAALPEDAADVERALVLAGRDRALGLARAFSIPDPLPRLALGLADLFADVGAPRLDLTQAELAAMASLSRHSVNRVLAQLEFAGAVVNHYRRVERADRAALLAVAAAQPVRGGGVDGSA